MPVAKGPSLTARNAVIAAVVAVAVAAGLFMIVLLAGQGGDIEVNLGDRDFRDLDANRIAAEIADRGPILFSDIGGGTRDIILQHLGDDAESGWLAFDAREPGAPRDCFLEWQPDTRAFKASCDPTVTYDEAGTGLPQYPVVVTDGDVQVDINADTEAEVP